ncbi:hypothetical protein DTO217A2_6250 [Paecilomyces variotii]|nr:hypothetical protein DTO217A2_6250 [Paecilomyces variotii]
MHWLNEDISDFKIRIIDGEWSKIDHGVEEKDSEILTAGEIEIPLLRSTYFPASNSAETTPLFSPSLSNTMSVRAPLVQGGHIRDALRVPEAFISRTLSEVYNNTIVVAATHPALNSTHATSDGWFLSDFYAFNYLLKGMGHPGDKDQNVPGQVLHAYQTPSSGYG